MFTKSRPQSSMRRPSTAIPKQMNQMHENDFIDHNTHKETLNNLVPDLPAFLTKNKSTTALLYSKFIVKGIKTNKLDLVRQSFNMKKQNLRYQKKMSLNALKTLRSTRNSTKNEALKSIKNQNNQQIQFVQRANFLNDSNYLNLEINNFFKVNIHTKTTFQNETERNLLKNASQNVLRRPKSAVNTPSKVSKLNRAQTAQLRRSQNLTNRQTFELDQFKATIPDKNLLTIINTQRPGIGFVNYIERNKRQLSASSKKTSIYLTGLDSNKIVQNLNKEIKKIPVKKYEQALKSHRHQLSMSQIPSGQEEFKSNRLTQGQVQKIKKTNKINANFMKKHMPNQYKKYVQYMVMKQNNYTQKDQVLLSVNLESNPNKQFGQINLNSKNQDEALDEANDYFTQYAHICEETEYYINKNIKRKEEAKTSGEVLHVGMCQQLLQLQNKRKKLTQKQKEKQAQINLRIYQIVSILLFFKQKTPEVCQKIFQLPFAIDSLEQDQIIIKKEDSIQYFYVILNGSVVKQSKNQKSQEQIILNQSREQSQIYSATLFDGQTFGEPDSPFEVKHKNQFKSAQKVLLLKFPYIQYKKICAQNESIGDKVQLLRHIFGNVSGCKYLNNQSLQAIAYQLQSSSYKAKEIIFRQSDICDKLIIVASGMISQANEHILKRNKKSSKDMRKKTKSVQKLKLQSYSVQKLRRNNLKNYQILKQNQEQFIFYYQNVSRQLIRGDVLNWEGFSFNDRRTTIFQQEQINNQGYQSLAKSFAENDKYRLKFSLISNADNTKIYTLNIKRIKNLPEQLKQVVYAKIQEVLKKQKKVIKQQQKVKIEAQKYENIQKWDQYKQKICNDIIKRKLKV